MSCLMIHFCNAKPSWTGVAIVCLLPESRIMAVERPQEKAAKTGALHMNMAGTQNFSNMNSVSLSLVSLLWIDGSVKSIGVSRGFISNWSIKLFLNMSSRQSKFTKNHIMLYKITYSVILKERLNLHIISLEAQVCTSHYNSSFGNVFHVYIL